MHLLDQGFDEGHMDSIRTSNCQTELTPLFSNLSNDSVAATDNTLEHGRTTAMHSRTLVGPPVVRACHSFVNSGVLRVTKGEFTTHGARGGRSGSLTITQAQHTTPGTEPLNMLGTKTY